MMKFMNTKVYDMTWGQYLKLCGVFYAIYMAIIGWIYWKYEIKRWFENRVKAVKRWFKR